MGDLELLHLLPQGNPPSVESLDGIPDFSGDHLWLPPLFLPLAEPSGDLLKVGICAPVAQRGQLGGIHQGGQNLALWKRRNTPGRWRWLAASNEAKGEKSGADHEPPLKKSATFKSVSPK
jgi:hypothetical protein